MCPRRFRSPFTVILGLGLLALCSPLWANTQPPSQDALTQAGLDLGSAEFATREAATRLLWQYAGMAQKQIEQAQASSDPEVRIRANRIAEAFSLGILPDTPPSVVKQIYAFHDGSLQEKQAIITQLVATDNLKTAYRLLRALTNPTLRDQLAQIIASRVRTKLLPLLLNGGWDQADTLLREAALGDLAMRDYATFAHLTGRLDAALTATGSGEQDRPLRIWLMRAAGHMEEAIAMAEDDPTLSRELRAANGDALAFCEDDLAQPNTPPSQRSRAEAFHARLSGDEAALKEATEALLTLAKDEKNPYTQRSAVEALLLNDVVEPVIPFLPKLLQQTAYDIQSYRGMYADALKQAGVAEERPPYEPWVEVRWKAVAQKEPGNAFQEIVDLASRVAQLGEKEEAARMLKGLFEACKENNIDRCRTLVTEEIRIGVRELAEQHLRELSKTGIRIDQIRDLLPFNNKLLIRQWHEFFMNDKTRPIDRLEALIEAWKIIDVDEGVRAPSAEAAKHLDAASEASATLNPKDRVNYLQNLYLTASVHHATERAARYLQEVAELAEDPTWYYLLGNHYWEKENFSEAAPAYEKAWNTHSAEVKASILASGSQVNRVTNRAPQVSRDSLQPSYLYLAGAAYREAGDTEKGLKMIEQASLLCLGDLEARYGMATAMDRNGDEALAKKEWALIARISQNSEPTGTWAFYHLASELQKTDPAKAIAYKERVIVARHLLSVKMDAQFTFNIRLRSLVHHWQTKLHVQEGDPDAALKSIERYWQLTPGNASIGEELLPLLEEAGKTAEAKAYYEKTRQFALEACRLFPNSAMAHNNLAWLDARSRRNLNEATDHAETAVRLRPGTAAYLDTLAEVHFASGNREKALELSNQAVELTPHDKELLGQHARFKNDPLPAQRAADE